ncbi:MFS transporter [Bacillus canaveralius]|uniref:MFS transporter n=1 Tax=Bacillus canaveralius TaxID=1403243 RepID=UPI000F78C644|nr:MFS transporter [Bacillus canaveralius]RSK50479.1 MFS transporter [Bacillus canaveralius]
MGTNGFRTFLFIWLGQLVSIVGSGLTAFALGVWVLEETGSVTMFSLILLFSTFPAIVFSPFAGVIVDRFDRRKVMIISDSIAGLGTLLIFALYSTNSLAIWHLYIILSISSVASSLQFPAYQAAVSTLVSKAHLGRASGMVQIAESVSLVISSILAGVLFKSFKKIFCISITAKTTKTTMDKAKTAFESQPFFLQSNISLTFSSPNHNLLPSIICSYGK